MQSFSGSSLEEALCFVHLPPCLNPRILSELVVQVILKTAERCTEEANKAILFEAVRVLTSKDEDSDLGKQLLHASAITCAVGVQAEASTKDSSTQTSNSQFLNSSCSVTSQTEPVAAIDASLQTDDSYVASILNNCMCKKNISKAPQKYDNTDITTTSSSKAHKQMKSQEVQDTEKVQMMTNISCSKQASPQTSSPRNKQIAKDSSISNCGSVSISSSKNIGKSNKTHGESCITSPELKILQSVDRKGSPSTEQFKSPPCNAKGKQVEVSNVMTQACSETEKKDTTITGSNEKPKECAEVKCSRRRKRGRDKTTNTPVITCSSGNQITGEKDTTTSPVSVKKKCNAPRKSNSSVDLSSPSTKVALSNRKNNSTSKARECDALHDTSIQSSQVEDDKCQRSRSSDSKRKCLKEHDILTHSPAIVKVRKEETLKKTENSDKLQYLSNRSSSESAESIHSKDSQSDRSSKGKIHSEKCKSVSNSYSAKQKPDAQHEADGNDKLKHSPPVSYKRKRNISESSVPQTKDSCKSKNENKGLKKQERRHSMLTSKTQDCERNESLRKCSEKNSDRSTCSEQTVMPKAVKKASRRSSTKKDPHASISTKTSVEAILFEGENCNRNKVSPDVSTETRESVPPCQKKPKKYKSKQSLLTQDGVTVDNKVESCDTVPPSKKAKTIHSNKSSSQIENLLERNSYCSKPKSIQKLKDSDSSLFQKKKSGGIDEKLVTQEKLLVSDPTTICSNGGHEETRNTEESESLSENGGLTFNQLKQVAGVLHQSSGRTTESYKAIDKKNLENKEPLKIKAEKHSSDEGKNKEESNFVSTFSAKEEKSMSTKEMNNLFCRKTGNSSSNRKKVCQRHKLYDCSKCERRQSSEMQARHPSPCKHKVHGCHKCKSSFSGKDHQKQRNDPAMNWQIGQRMDSETAENRCIGKQEESGRTSLLPLPIPESKEKLESQKVSTSLLPLPIPESKGNSESPKGHITLLPLPFPRQTPLLPLPVPGRTSLLPLPIPESKGNSEPSNIYSSKSVELSNIDKADQCPVSGISPETMDLDAARSVKESSLLSDKVMQSEADSSTAHQPTMDHNNNRCEKEEIFEAKATNKIRSHSFSRKKQFGYGQGRFRGSLRRKTLLDVKQGGYAERPTERQLLNIPVWNNTIYEGLPYQQFQAQRNNQQGIFMGDLANQQYPQSYFCTNYYSHAANFNFCQY